MTRSTFSQ